MSVTFTSPNQASSPTLKLVPCPLLVVATLLAVIPAAVNTATFDVPDIPTATLPLAYTTTFDVPLTKEVAVDAATPVSADPLPIK